MDYARKGLRIISVSPGSVHTPLVESLLKQDGSSIAELGLRAPRGQVAKVEELASLCLYLASPQAANITGSDVICDGGLMAMGSWDGRMSYTSNS